MFDEGDAKCYRMKATQKITKNAVIDRGSQKKKILTNTFPPRLPSGGQKIIFSLDFFFLKSLLATRFNGF